MPHTLHPHQTVAIVFDFDDTLAPDSTASLLEELGIDVEYFLLSCGLGDIIRHTPIASRFSAVWANEFHYDEEGRACFIRRVISHTEKTRYLFHIARGVKSSQEAERSFEVSQRIPPEELRIPLSQFIYVGDGLTDIPCFSLVEARHGVAIGVSKAPRRGAPRKQRGESVGVDALIPADYRPGGALSEALHLALVSVCQRIALRQYHAAQESP